MNELTAALKEELNVDTAFTLPIFGGIDIPESIAVSWGIMAFLVIVSILLTRNLKGNHISKRQAILETAVVTMDNFFKDLLGEAGKQYVPYLITVALYIACSNLIGIIGLKPPTKDLNVTAALAIMSIVLIEYSGIHAKGGKRFVHSLAEPIALMTPMNILEIAIRPTSLCMRLFGNVLGAFVIMELIKLVVPVFVPAIFSLYFDLCAGIAALTGIGAGIGIGIATGKAAEAISRQPEAESKISKNLLLGAALAEGTAIFGFVVALLIILFLG